MAVDRKSSISYGVGGVPYAIKESAYTMFVLLFYTQVLGLGGTETGVVLFLGLVWDAVTDPLMGSWSHRFISRWGRRHPFMAVLSMRCLGHRLPNGPSNDNAAGTAMITATPITIDTSAALSSQ